MTPFLAKGAHTFKGRIRGEDGAPRIISLGVKDKAEATEIEKMFRWLAEKRKWAVLQLILDKQVTPAAVYDAHVGGYLERLVQDTAKRMEAEKTIIADPPLQPLLDQWGTDANARYVGQVTHFLTTLGPNATVSRFRRREVSAFLGSLRVGKRPATGSTKRRYRVGLSQFARFLVERELLDTNVVRDVKGASENKPRMLFHTRTEAQALIAVLSGPQQALEALMAGCGVEYGAAILVRRRDIDPAARSVWAQGSKNEYRNRRVFFTEDWAWELFWSYAKDFTPNARLFAWEERSKEPRDAHRAACEQAKVRVTRLHDWRHTYAIYSLDDGMQPQAVKAQLGHSPNSTILERVYAAWLPKDRAAYRKRLPATDSATNPRGGNAKKRSRSA